jgi:hypothetical protein
MEMDFHVLVPPALQRCLCVWFLDKNTLGLSWIPMVSVNINATLLLKLVSFF